MRLSQDRDLWRAVVSTVMNLRMPLYARNFLACRVTVAFSRKDSASLKLDMFLFKLRSP